MPEYSYQASSEDGQRVTGELSADSVSEAIAAIEQRGLTVESISLSSIPQHRPQEAAPQEHPSRLEHATLDHQIDAVIQRRDILAPALEALAAEMPAGRARGEIRQLAEMLARAPSASQLRHNEVVLQWLPLLATGFAAESSTRCLSGMIAGASRESQNRSERRRLLVYPLAVTLIALIVFALLCVLVVPTFGSMFGEFGLQLPTPTLIVVLVADQLSNHPARSLIGLGLIAAAIYGGLRIWTHFALTTRLFGSFVAGNSTSVSAMASLTHQLAELLNIKVSLPDALWIAGQGCRHYHFKKVAQQLARFVHDTNRPLSESPSARYLPANVVFALQAGPGGDPSIGLLRELSAIYGDRVGSRVDWARGATAQLAIVVVGIAVAFVVIALFMPMFTLVSGLS